MAASQLHIAAKSWASNGRRCRSAGEEELARIQFAYALDYELKALNILLEYEYANESDILDCYKFAAIYAADYRDWNKARELVQDALKRSPPEKIRRELVGLLDDFSNIS